MKRAGILLAATVAAASSYVSASPDHESRAASAFHYEGSPSSVSKDHGSGSVGDMKADKFAPRFDGLRFIETLVTAHR